MSHNINHKHDQGKKAHSKKRHHKNKRHKHFFRKWHRRIGFAASIFLFNLAITGIILNHYESLKLHQAYISNPLLLDWYGVKAPQTTTCFDITIQASPATKICELAGQVYQRDQQHNISLMFDDQTALINVLSKDDLIFVIGNKSLRIYTAQMQLVDQFDWLDQVDIFTANDQIIAATLFEQMLIIKSSSDWLVFDDASFEFSLLRSKENEQSLPVDNLIVNQLNQQIALAAPSYQLQDKLLVSQLQHRYRAQQISWLKFVQDLHSGQLFKISGKLVTDLIGVMIMLLAISGFITWQRRKNKRD